MRLPADLLKHSRGRLGRAVVVALVLLAGAGTGAAVALLPPGLRGSDAERGTAPPLGPVLVGAIASDGTPPRRIGEGRLAARTPKPARAARAYYRRTSSRHVPASAQAGFMPLYREAARSFGVSWRLIASIHRQETAFSTAPGTYRGLNFFGCCAGPMQFNVKNGPVSTWKLYRQSFRRGDRPRRYPHRTRSHPSVYDDFDAIMAAGALLSDSGATAALDRSAWFAAYAYYGHDSFGTRYASQVVARARGWKRDGFCLNCPLDDRLVAALDEAYGIDARRQLRGAETRQEQKKREKRKKKREKQERRKRQQREKARRARAKAERREAARRSSARKAARTPPTATQAPRTPSPAPATTPAPAATPEAAPEPTPAAPPVEDSCTAVSRLLGCGR